MKSIKKASSKTRVDRIKGNIDKKGLQNLTRF